LSTIKGILERGITSGEFRKTPVTDNPQLIIAPALFAVIWKLVFVQHPLDSDTLIDANIDMILEQIRA
jgi:hypothetical protein